MRILVVEDAPRLRRYVAEALAQAGYAVDAAADGDEGLLRAELHDYDVVVLDLMLPGLDGLSLLDRLREARNEVCVLILTARDTVEDRVNGLQRGADDYLIKPFALEELLARIQALARRRYRCPSAAVAVADLVVDTARRTVHRDGYPLDLRPREYALLEYLVLRKGHVVTRAEIENHIYDEAADLASNAIDAAISRLRRKIDSPPRPSLIQTRRGMGYILDEAES